MFWLKLYILTIFLTVSIHAISFDLGTFFLYFKNLFESRVGLPTLETDFIATQTALLSYLKTNKATYDDPDAYLNISQLVNKNGFPFELHRVTTEDGYILTIHRIPSDGPVVFLNHGILLSSDDYVTAGVNSATAYYLAARGYDVWLGNARGNKHSKRHVYLSPNDPAFYNFSFHEIAVYDLPVTIDYILARTGQHKLNYVGFSQGTTTIYILCSLKPEYNEKFNVIFSLSPIAYFSRLFSPVLRFAYKINLFQFLMAIGQNDVLPNPKLLFEFCNANNIFQFICVNLVDLAFGFDRGELNYTNIPVITSHTFAGSSAKQFEHYGQIIYSGRFRQYDYGKEENLRRYGSPQPPDYPLNKVTAPVVLTYSLQDFFSSVVDVQQLRESLPNVVGYFQADGFDHIDYVYGRSLNTVINPRILEFIQKFASPHYYK